MSDKKILVDSNDRSVNIISPVSEGGYFETRAVWRERTLIIYLSSTSGCDKACRMCHLTQTGQTSMNHAMVNDYLRCAQDIFEYLKTNDDLGGIDTLHYNFMARGDAMANPHFLKRGEDIVEHLGKVANDYLPEVPVKFKISTIFPQESEKDTVWNLLEGEADVEFYYSLYSLKPEFRKRWLPKAMNPNDVGEMFRGRTKGLRIHHALIKGQNDFYKDVALIHHWLFLYDLTVGVNIVQYNPFGPQCGEEASVTQTADYLLLMLSSENVNHGQIVTRVGRSVHASCGTFYNSPD